MIPFELRLTRADLNVVGQTVPIEEVQIYHVSRTMRDVALSHRTIVTDDDGTTTVLKHHPSSVNITTIVRRPSLPTLQSVQDYIMNLERY